MLIYNKYKVVQIELPYIYVVNQQISLTEPKNKKCIICGCANWIICFWTIFKWSS